MPGSIHLYCISLQLDNTPRSWSKHTLCCMLRFGSLVHQKCFASSIVIILSIGFIAQKDIFKDLNNYGLCSRTRHSLGRQASSLGFCHFVCCMHISLPAKQWDMHMNGVVHLRRRTTWNTLVEVPNLENVYALIQMPGSEQAPLQAHGPAGTSEATPPEHVTAELTASLPNSAAGQPDQPAKLTLNPQETSSSRAAEAERCAGRSSAGGWRPRRRHREGTPPELCPAGPPVKGRTWVKHQVAGHDVLAAVAFNEEFLDSAAAYCRVPLCGSLDLASQDRQDGIQYRVGIHHVGPPTLVMAFNMKPDSITCLLNGPVVP